MGKTAILVISILFVSHSSFSRTSIAKVPQKLEQNPSELPSFPGGWAKWQEYIESSVVFPEVLKKYKVSDVVLIEVVVTTDGDLINPKIIKGNFDARFSDQLLQAIKKSPMWIPAKKNGVYVSVKAVIPVKVTTE